MGLGSHSGTAVMNVDISHRREKGASKDLPWAKFRNCPAHALVRSAAKWLFQAAEPLPFTSQ